MFVDIDPATYNMDMNLLEKAITKRTKVVIPIHLFGQCADMKPLLELSEKHGFAIVEDAAQAMGAKYGDKMAGSMGTTGCFSFFPTKNLGCFGDGGIVTTNDDALADKIRMLRVHGSKPKYYHHHVGINSRLDALQAAILKVKLPHLQTWNQGRQRNAAWYREHLAVSDVTHPYCGDGNYHIYNQYVIRVPERDALMQHLQEAGIGNAVYYPLPLHMQPCFAHCGYREGSLPHAERAAKETISIPIYAELTEEQLSYVAETITRFYKSRSSVRAD